MGADAYLYYTKYQDDVDTALQQLRQTEFEAGRYFPAMMTPVPPHFEGAPAGPGAQHDSIDEARMAAEEQGTCSILDIDHLSDTPDYCAAAPLDPALAEKHFGSNQPTRDMIEKSDTFFDICFEVIDRGQCVYATVYKDGKPGELVFAGLTFD